MATTEEQAKQLDDQLALLQKRKAVLEAQKALDDAQKTESNRLKQLKDSSDLLTQQKNIAENQQAIAEAQKATAAAAFPKGEIKPLEGDITTNDKFGYIAELVAYQSMKERAEEVGQQIDALVVDEAAGAVSTKNLVPSDKILIVNDLDFASGDIVLIQVESMLRQFQGRITEQTTDNTTFLGANKPKIAKREEKIELKTFGFIPGIGLALPVISGIVSSVAEIMSYFQINYDIKGQDFTLDQQAIISIVSGNIKKVNTYIYSFNRLENSELIYHLINDMDLKQKLDASTDRIKTEIIKKTNEDILKTKETIAQLEKKLKPRTETEKEGDSSNLDTAKAMLNAKTLLLDSANAKVDNSESLSKAFSVFIDSITKTADEKTLPLLVKAALRQYYTRLGITHLLNLKILSSGGEAITKKSRFSSGLTAFIGGNVISYVLAKTTGEIIQADSSIGLGHLNYELSADKSPVYRKILLPGNQHNKK